MKKITQKEALEVFKKTPYPNARRGNEEQRNHLFNLRFMFKLNDLTKSRGYRLFSWTDYCGGYDIIEIQVSYAMSNIDILSQQMIRENNGE